MNDTLFPHLSPLRSSRPRRVASLAAILVALGCVAACGSRSPEDGAGGAGAERHPLILVSFDGFRWDYLDRGLSPNLSELAKRGVRADGLIPSFPTKTFPNHYTLVTGLVPDRHGIVSNTMWDPEFEARFSGSIREEVQDARWWGGEPIWVTAERHGLPTAPIFWVGSEAPIKGVRPSYWQPYDSAIPYESRIDRILELLDLPVRQRPTFLTLYFAQVDDAGHRWGPDSPELEAAVASVDRAFGRLIEGLASRGLREEVNVVAVSDHGMIETSRGRVIFVDDYVDLDEANPVDWNPVLALWPRPDHRDRVYRELRGAHPELSVYRREEIPEHLDYRHHRRVPPILGLASPGWSITSHSFFDRQPERFDGGSHGYDPTERDMQGIFIAAGPAYSSGARVPAFRNVHVYPLIMATLGLPTVESDGDLEAVPGILNE